MTYNTCSRCVPSRSLLLWPVLIAAEETEDPKLNLEKVLAIGEPEPAFDVPIHNKSICGIKVSVIATVSSSSIVFQLNL